MRFVMNSKDPVSTYMGTTNLPIYNPVVLGLKPHQGPVYSVKSSPFHRNIFLTTGADGTVRLYHILKMDPLVNSDLASGHTLSACWSPIRPMVFAVALSNGQVALYDLNQKEQAPLIKFDATSNSNSVLTVCFNPQKADVLATGDSQGVIKIRKLGDRFATQAANEEKRLNSLAMRNTEN